MTLDDLTNQLRDVLSANTGADLQKNIRATLSAGLNKLDVVTRQEFDIQRDMLDALRKQIDELTTQVDKLEQQRSSAK